MENLSFVHDIIYAAKCETALRNYELANAPPKNLYFDIELAKKYNIKVSTLVFFLQCMVLECFLNNQQRIEGKIWYITNYSQMLPLISPLSRNFLKKTLVLLEKENIILINRFEKYKFHNVIGIAFVDEEKWQINKDSRILKLYQPIGNIVFSVCK